MGRIILAGVLGAVAMFAWAALAHMSPLGQVGFKTLPAATENALVDSVKTATGEQGGLYMAPAAQMEKMTGRGPRLLTVYTPDASYEMSPMQLGGEFGIELAQSIILAFLLAGIAAGVGGRIAYAVAAGIMVGIATNGSYHIWFGFPHDYTAAQILIQVVEYLVAGIVIALVLRRHNVPA